MPDRSREEEVSSFKVNDRRQFTNEGDRRKESEDSVPKTAAPANPSVPETNPSEPPTSAQLTNAETEFRSHADRHAGPVGFEHLVMYLATSAMYHLGLDPNSPEESPKVDLPAARQTIDLLDILQQKTAGNLTDPEKRMMEGSLFELRMVFVEISKREQGC